jgi:hypothetical protein
MESVYALFLTFLILGALMFLLQQISKARTTIKEGGLVTEIYHACTLIRSDLGAAQSVVSPTSGSGSMLSVVTLLPRFEIADRPTGTDPYLPEEQVTTTYQLSDGKLRRRRTGTDISSDDALLELVSFAVRRDEGRIEVDFGIKNERRERVHTMLFRVKP